MLKVYKKCCQNCLFSKDRIVSPHAAKRILNDCKERQTHFFCHKSTMEGKEIVCATFYKEMGEVSNLVRVAQRLKMVEFVEQQESERLPSYKDMRPYDEK